MPEWAHEYQKNHLENFGSILWTTGSNFFSFLYRFAAYESKNMYQLSSMGTSTFHGLMWIFDVCIKLIMLCDFLWNVVAYLFVQITLGLLDVCTSYKFMCDRGTCYNCLLCQCSGPKLKKAAPYVKKTNLLPESDDEDDE